MRDKFIKFMYGRYGVDEYGKTMLLVAVVLSFFGILVNLVFRVGWISFVFSSLSSALMIFIICRAFSKNINKRVLENHKFLARTEKIRSWMRFQRTKYNDRNRFRYVKCPGCKNYSRVPKGKGRIKITCRVCKKHFEKDV